jgi:CRP-like cAMP-binding protein
VAADNYAVLRAMPVLEDVKDRVVEWLAGVVEEREFGYGTRIITEGAEDRDCYFITEGATDVSIGGRVIGQTPAGECEGEMALFFERPRGATTIATTKVRVLCLRAESYDQLAQNDPVAANLLRNGVLAHMQRRFGSSRYVPDPSP